MLSRKRGRLCVVTNVVFICIFFSIYGISAQRSEIEDDRCDVLGGVQKAREERSKDFSLYLHRLSEMQEQPKKSKALFLASAYLVENGYYPNGPSAFDIESLQRFCQDNRAVLLNHFSDLFLSQVFTVQYALYLEEAKAIDESGFLVEGSLVSSAVTKKDPQKSADVVVTCADFLKAGLEYALKGVFGSQVEKERQESYFRMVHNLFHLLLVANHNDKHVKGLLCMSYVVFIQGYALCEGPRSFSAQALQAIARENISFLEKLGFKPRAISALYEPCDVKLVPGYYIDERGRVAKGNAKHFALDDYSRMDSIAALMLEDMDAHQKMKVLITVNKGAAQTLLKDVCEVVEKNMQLFFLPCVVDREDLVLFCQKNVRKTYTCKAYVLRGEGVCLIKGHAERVPCAETQKWLDRRQSEKRKALLDFQEVYQEVQHLGFKKTAQQMCAMLADKTVKEIERETRLLRREQKNYAEGYVESQGRLLPLCRFTPSSYTC